LLRKVEFFLGIWFSPSSGIAFFWPIATCLIVGTLVVAICRFRSRGDWLSPALVLFVGALFVATLAAWYAPFGWVTYGPRLAAPMLPAMVVVGATTVEPELTASLRRLARYPAAAVLVAGAVAIVVLPQAAAPWSYEASMRSLMAADSTCPKMSEITLADPTRYYECVRDYTWRWRPSALWSATTDRPGAGPYAQVIGALAAATLTYGALRPPARTSREADRESLVVVASVS
jgi:hypothetical protein